MLIGLMVMGSAAALPAADDLRPLLRFPDIHGDTVVFVNGEDVWTAPVAGGRAHRLTDDEGEDRHPRFSPDGSLIAFSSEAGGNRDVWVMGRDGSNPRRLTFHPADDEAVGWHPVHNTVIFRSNRQSWSRFDRLFSIAPDGSGVEVLPLHEAGRGDISPDGTRIVYNRIAREERTWKRYRGGMAQDLWLYDFATATDRRLTTYRGTDRLPMWVGHDIVFASDRDGALNLYRLETERDRMTRLTNHETWDVRRPASDGRRIVYELAGDLWLLDPESGEDRRLDIRIPTQPREVMPYRREVADEITHVAPAPEGGRAVVCARGEVFTVPKKHGDTRNLSRTPAARDQGARWSPDGKHIAWLSDADGEMDIWLAPANGLGSPKRLTDLGPGYRHTLRWSPDSRHIAFADQTLAFFVLEVDSGRITEVDRSEREPMDAAVELKPISDFAWSPDGRYIAYSKIGLDMVSRVWVFDRTSGETHDVSDGRFHDFAPAFTRDGEHLLFISNRHFSPTLGDFEWEMVYKDMAGIYSLTLRSSGEPLLPLRSDEVAPAIAGEDDETDDQGRTNSAGIDFDGLADRIQPLPVPPGNYRSLAVADGKVVFLNGSDGDYNPFEFRALGPQRLEAFNLEDRQIETLRTAVSSFELAADGRSYVWRDGDDIGIGDIAAKDETSKALDLSGLVVTVDPRAEWAQVFDEAWRIERDFFYDPNMHGLDWQAIGNRYRTLVPRATCAQDMRFILGELIGELSTSHTYVRSGGGRRQAELVEVGMLGADFEAVDGRWRIRRILSVADWSREVWPPLAAPGVDVREGEFLLTVNGVEVTAEREVSAWMQGTAGSPTRLTVGPDPEHARAVTVVPLDSERRLRYLAWVEHNRHVVDEASGGTIGYIHLPDTYVGSATEFARQYYSQVMKQGLIVDGRFNGGGLDPDIFLARLAKKPISYWTRRYSADQATPWFVSSAHMVCLTNRQAGSGGDELPHEFRAKGMGPVIGTRTWGGLVGISMGFQLMDGSGLTAPDYRIYNTEGWLIENEGVAPDIEVELDPAEMARGWDAQLQKGIEVLREMIDKDPVSVPQRPPFPARDDR